VELTASHTTNGNPATIMSKKLKGGFTLIELLVVMAIIAVLLTIATPRYFHSVDKSKEAVLHQNLELTRQSIDKYFSDNGKYPDALDDLVQKKYLRSLPYDPITESNSTWILLAPATPDKGGIYDIKSGALGSGANGTDYKDW
jgi:general secretion pathway protein G